MRHALRVLVVDDEASMRDLMIILLQNDGYEVVAVGSVVEACTAIEQAAFDAVLTDLRMGSDRKAGMTLMSWIHAHAPGTPAIMMTAHGSVETAIEAMKLGAADYVLKPFKNDEIRMLVRRAIEQRDLKRENAALRKEQARHGQLDNMVGTSAAMGRIRGMIRQLASLPSTIAIHGESGTGKELVARGIHQLSGRSEKPFVAINCGSIPENLLESELFGHRKGAFTGATENKEGLFVVADGGTLFLDEIGELPLTLQVRLLRVLDNGVIMAVGSTSPVKVDVRIVSATNRDLELMVREARFREDLYYRLNVIPITVPPLREREDDIPVLARHFLAESSRSMKRVPPAIHEETLTLLGGYDWPGNVRELRNAIEHAVALCSGDLVRPQDLPKNVVRSVAPPAAEMSRLPQGGVDLEGLIANIEIDLINQALAVSRHSQKRAAEMLGLTARSLRYRLQKYGLAEE